MLETDFDILLPVYGRDCPILLDKALYSIFANTRQATKIIIGIDGPIPDDIEAEINKYEKIHKNIFRVTHEINLGLSENLNKMIDFCDAEIIIRCDADDINSKVRFETLLNFLIKNKNVGVVSSAVRETDNTGRSVIKYLPQKHADLLKFSLWRNPINHMAVALRKDLLVDNRYPNIRYKEDYALWLNLLKQGVIFHNLKDVLVDVSSGTQQLNRRRGFSNIASEAQLFWLKADLFGISKSFIVTSLRICLLLLPSTILRPIYMLARK